MKKFLLFSFGLAISILQAWGQAACPANNTCANAYTLTMGATCSTTSFNISSCSDENAVGDCTDGTAADNTLWFKFVATSANATVVVAGGTGSDMVVGALTTCGTTTRPTGGTCTDNTGDGQAEIMKLTGLTIGNTYFLGVHEYNADATGTGTICVVATPANDVCSGATALTPSNSCVPTSFSIAEYTDEDNSSDCGIGTVQRTLWFKFVASGTIATITATGGTGTDLSIGAITTCGSIARPTGGTCVDATGDGATETLNLTGLTIGTTYYVSVHERNGDATGTGTICVVAPPANDVCSGAISLTPSTTCSPVVGSTNGATDNNETGDCDLGTEKAVWYKFTATQATHEVFVTGSAGFDPVVQVLSACGSATSPTGGACANVTGDAGKEVIFLSGLTIGTTYFVQVHDFNGDNGVNSTFSICVTSPTVPTCGTNPSPTDACSSAPLINNLESFCGTTSGFTVDTDANVGASHPCGFNIENNSYFKFVAAATEVTLNFWLTGGGSCSSGIQISLHAGTCGSMTKVACSANPTGGTGSSGVFNIGGLTVGTTYYVMIDGYAGNVCNYSLAAVSGVAAVCNDCTKAACATNGVADDYYSLETTSASAGNWNSYGAIAATGTPYTANGTNQAAYTVCTDIMPTSSTFIGFDYLLNVAGSTAAISEIKSKGTFTLVGVTQELSTGVCTTLIPSGTNAFGMPEFNDAGGTPGVTAGAFDHTKPMTVCLSYSLPATATGGGTVSGFTVMGYGCASPTGVTVGAQGACSSNTYSQTLTVAFNPANLPTPAVSGGTGNVSLTVNGQVFAITPAEQTAGSKVITLTNLTANGASVNVSAYFSNSSMCVFTLNNAFTAPSCICAAPPSVNLVETSVSICSATTFNYTVANGPATLSKGTGTGTLSTTSLPNGTSTFTYTPSVGDVGNTFTLTATIADPDGAGACVASTDAITVSVISAPTVSIAPTQVYQGDRTFVATTNVPSGTITYTFKKNNVTQQSSTSPVWNATGLLQNDVIACSISVAGSSCSSASSTSNSVTIQAPLTPNYCSAIVPAADQSVNCGASVTLQSTLRTIYEVKQTSCDAITVSSPTAVTLTDDAVTANIPLGFSFDFFGTPYTDCRIHSNGIVSFGGQTYTGYTAVTIPNGSAAPNNYIAGFYTDLHPGCGGSITYKTIGTAPNRQFVVSYTDIEPYYDGITCSASSADAVSFQIVLEETTNLVRIIMVKLPSTFVAGFSGSRVANATQGIEAGDGSVAFTTPGRNWQVWNNPSLTPAYRDCTTFGPVNYTSSFVDWKLGGAQVSTTNPYTFNATATGTYTATWNLNGVMCTDDVQVSIANSPTLTLETATNISNCTTPNGSIALTLTNTANGTYLLSYQKDGTPQTANITVTAGAATLSNLAAGIYSNFSINIGGCTATATGSRTITVASNTITLGSPTASTSCTTPNGSLPLTFTNVANGTYTLSYTQDGVAKTASITITGNAATLSGLGGGVYANFSLTALGCTVSGSGSATVNAPSGPTASGVTICQGGSGSLTSGYTCGTGFTTATNTITGSWNGATDPTAFRPTSVTNSSTCSFSTASRNYKAIQFQVSVTGNYIFEMANNAAYDGSGYIYTGSFTPGTCGTWVRGDDDDSPTDDEPRLGAAGSGSGVMTLTAGVTYTLVSTTYGSAGTVTGSFSWTVTPPLGGSVLLSGTGAIQWYAVPTGGTALGTGASFNPVGVLGSGLANTNTAGTTTYYAACSNDPTCRTAVSFVINSNVTPTVSISPFNIFASSQTITATTTNTGGGTVTYTFKKDGATQQTGASNTWNATGLIVGQLITCDISIAGGTCLATNTATSNTATVRTAPSPSGIRGNALTYNGTNQSVIIPDQNILDMTSNYTLEVWVKFGSLTGAQPILSKNTGANNGYHLSRNGSALEFDGLSTAGSVINGTDWHHIAAVNDNGTRRLYVNGWEQTLAGTPITVAANTQPISIGYDAKANAYFQGQIDEVRIWNVVRSQFDLRENMHLVLAGLETGLVSYYQFNQNSGTSLTDIISQNHGVLQNAPTWGISHANVGRGTSNTINVSTGGSKVFTGTNCKLAFSGNLPMGDIVVSRVEGLPAGVNLVTTGGEIISVYTRYYWVINNFGTANTGLTVSPTFILGANQIALVDALGGLKMDKRPTNKDIPFTPHNAQNIISTATGEVTFVDIDSFSEFVVHSIQNSLLPTDGLTFKGERKDAEQVRLAWQTVSEAGLQGFELEMSTDNQSFESVARVEGRGKASQGASYEQIALQPLDAYYRLKLLQANGAYKYSNTIFVAGYAGELLVYPNPTQGELHIRMNGVDTQKERLKVTVYDAAGRQVLKTDAPWIEAEREVRDFLMRAQGNGNYLLVISTRNKTYKKKVILMK